MVEFNRAYMADFELIADSTTGSGWRDADAVPWDKYFS